MTIVSEAEKPARTNKRPSIFKRFGRDREGATVVEFALLAMPFCVLTFAILESCISFAGQEVLANSADEIARQLRTGQVKAADMTETKLKTMICDKLSVIVAAGCPGLVVDLRQYATFDLASKETIKFTSDRDLDTTGFAVTPGPSLSKNMLRVFYKWPVMTDFMSAYMSNMKGGKTLHVAITTWQNEPFDD